MSEPEKFFMRGAAILWPSLFAPSVIERGEEAKYRCNFTVPEGVVPPEWAFVKTTSKYGLPENTRYISVQSLKPMPVFGVSESLIADAARTMQSPDRSLHRAQADVVLRPWEGRNGAVYLIADAIRVTSELTLPTFETFLGDLQ